MRLASEKETQSTTEMADSTPRQVSAAEHFNNYAKKYEKNSCGATRFIARHLAELTGTLQPGSSILDNASGTGIVLDELLKHINSGEVKASLRITAVDAAPAMIDVLKANNETRWKLSAEQLTTKDLSAEAVAELPENSFTHSYTNFGFQFFKDPVMAAQAVYRTLKPGGVAYVTTWAELGYTSVIEEVSRRIRPGSKPLAVPFSSISFEDNYLESLMREAGFTDADVHQTPSKYDAESIDEMARTLGEGFQTLAEMQGWTEEQIAKLMPALKECLGTSDVVQRGQNSVYIPMLANVGVCRKV